MLLILNIKQRFETARQHSILDPERIVGKPEVYSVPRSCNAGRTERLSELCVEVFAARRSPRRPVQFRAARNLRTLRLKESRTIRPGFPLARERHCGVDSRFSLVFPAGVM